ncbi:MAG: ZIP family metal transporter [Candidatus Nealsonbacteria bacterium]
MPVLFIILLATFLVSLTSFIGALALLLQEKLLNKLLLTLVAFSAGSMIGGAFLHLLPEAIKQVGAERSFTVFLYAIFGFIAFFVLEHFIHWHHHHAKDHPHVMPFSYLILISDSAHNFIDGFVIAAAFIISVPLGVVTTLAVALHEIPQEIGDLGLLLYGGFNKSRALLLNFISALTAMLGGVIGFFLSGSLGDSIVFLLPFAAGNFIYIASSDLIPEIKEKFHLSSSILYFFVFLLGIGLMFLLKLVDLGA